jgi:hypothetical protein
VDQGQPEADRQRREAGRRLAVVEPMMMNRKNIVSTSSARNAANRLYWPGECAP